MSPARSRHANGRASNHCRGGWVFVHARAGEDVTTLACPPFAIRHRLTTVQRRFRRSRPKCGAGQATVGARLSGLHVVMPPRLRWLMIMLNRAGPVLEISLRT